MNNASDITLYHNPKCSSCRNTLGLIRNSGVEPRIVEYLVTPLDRAALQRLLAEMGVSARALLRTQEPLYQSLDLGAARWSEAELIGFMAQHPILMNRPIVATPLGTKLCRPPETVLSILPLPQKGRFVKENGEMVIDDSGRFVEGSGDDAAC